MAGDSYLNPYDLEQRRKDIDQGMFSPEAGLIGQAEKEIAGVQAPAPNEQVRAIEEKVAAEQIDPNAALAAQANQALGFQIKAPGAGYANIRDTNQTLEASNKELAKAAQARMDAAAKTVEAVKAQSAAETEVYKAGRMQQEAVMQQEAGIQAERDQFAKEWQSQYQTAYEDWKSARPDAERWQKENRARSVVATILGGLGMAIAGRPGENPVLGIIDRMIDRDIEEQDKVYQAKRAALGELKEARGMKLDEFGQRVGDLEHRRAFEKQAMLDSLQEVQSQFAGTKAEAAAGEAVAALSADLAKDQVNLMQQASGQRQQARMGQAQLDMSAAAQNAQNAAAVETARAKAQGEGQKVTAAAAGEMGDLATAENIIDGIEASFDKDIGVVSGVSQYTPWPSDAKKFNDQKRVAAQVVGGILEGGKLTDTDYEKYLDMLPNPGDSVGTAKNKVQQLKMLIRLKREGKYQGLQGAGFAAEGLKPPSSDELKPPEMLQRDFIPNG